MLSRHAFGKSLYGFGNRGGFGLVLRWSVISAWSVESRKIVALSLPQLPAYSTKVTEGVLDRHLACRDLTIIEVPRFMPGDSPFSEVPAQVDGLIVWAEARDRWVRDFVARGVPVVNCGMEWQGVEGVTSIHMNFPEIHRRVVDHFRDLGMRRVVAIGHRLSERPMTARIMNSFVELVRQAGMDGRLWELDGEDSPSVMPRRLLATGQETALEQFLKSLPKPVGIHCFGDHLGFIVCEVAARAGLKIPDDLVIIGFGDNHVASFSNPPMTSVSGDAREVGRAAADCMAAWLRTGRQPFQDLTVDGTVLMARESSVGKSGSVVIEAVQRFIRSEARRGLTLGELVAMSGLSVKTLVSQYRQAYGMEPTEAIHRHRLAEARRLLEDRDKPLAEVAVECGFSSGAAFANYFKRHAGHPPREIRKLLDPKGGG